MLTPIKPTPFNGEHGAGPLAMISAPVSPRTWGRSAPVRPALKGPDDSGADPNDSRCSPAIREAFSRDCRFCVDPRGWRVMHHQRDPKPKQAPGGTGRAAVKLVRRRLAGCPEGTAIRAMRITSGRASRNSGDLL